MKKSTKVIASSTGMLAIAAFSGLIVGATKPAAASTTNSVSAARTAVVAGAKAVNLEDAAKHACKGQNACKGQGGCKTGDAGCKGKNSCKGNGGCKTADTTQPAPGFLS